MKNKPNTVPLGARVLAWHVLVGAVIGMLILHPVTKIVYWYEYRDKLGSDFDSLFLFLVDRFESAFIVEMIPMSLIFAFIGGSIGLAFAIYHLALIKQQQLVSYLERELAEDLPSLIIGGESEHLEFKSSVRWDFRHNKLNRGLETVIAKTIAGFMNHRGGSLLVGVTDDGQVVGLEGDYQTFRHKNRDGFELCIIDIISSRLSADLCVLVHCMFYEVDGKDVCRILIESSVAPVYLKDGDVSKYFLRTGNATRELDAREALAHVTSNG